MDGEDCRDILDAISTLKTEIAVLKTEQGHTKNYIFKEIKPDMDKLYKRMGWLTWGTFSLTIAIFTAIVTILVRLL